MSYLRQLYALYQTWVLRMEYNNMESLKVPQKNITLLQPFGNNIVPFHKSTTYLSYTEVRSTYYS